MMVNLAHPCSLSVTGRLAGEAPRLLWRSLDHFHTRGSAEGGRVADDLIAVPVGHPVLISPWKDPSNLLVEQLL